LGSNQNIEAALIDRCKKGDNLAQMHLYDRYNKAMFNLCLRFFPDPQEAETMMHDAFIKAFQRLTGLREVRTFPAWFKRITINHCLEKLRQTKPGWEPLEEHQLTNLAEPEPEPEAFTEVPEKVDAAIDALPDGYRIVLSLYLLEGYDHEEIGEILQIAPASSRSQYSRALQQLRKLLQ